MSDLNNTSEQSMEELVRELEQADIDDLKNVKNFLFHTDEEQQFNTFYETNETMHTKKIISWANFLAKITAVFWLLWLGFVLWLTGSYLPQAWTITNFFLTLFFVSPRSNDG